MHHPRITPHLSLLARYGLLIAAVVAATTCSDSSLAPGRHASASFDVQSLMAAAQSSPIPIDTFLIELRRLSDSALVVSDTVDADSVGITSDADSVVLDVMVPLESDSEQFYLYLAVIGEGTVWLEVRGVVTATVGESTTTPELVPTFVGPGYDATSVTISLADTTITGGDSVLVTGSVFRGQARIDGAPVRFASSDETLVASPRQVGRNQAWITAPRAQTDSATITAIAITAGDSLTDSGILRFFARPDALVMVSGNDQNIAPGATAENPLVVQVLDAAGDPFSRGYQVAFNLSAGPSGTVLLPETTVTDAVGMASANLTAGDVAGVIQVAAEAQGLSGSPVLFMATVGDVGGPAAIAVNAGDGQSATVGTAVRTAPSVIVTDLGGAPVPDVEVVFAVASGGGSITGATDTTDAGGVATVGSWTLGQTAGGNTLTATVSGLSPLTITATGTPDAPTTLTSVSGNDQTADGGTTLPAPLVVEVRDQFGNPIPNTSVVWSVSHGSVNPASGPTDATGRAQTSWTLGTGAQTQTATASVSGLTPVIFTATATFQNPTILLALVGASRIPLGGTVDLAVTLSSPAPVGGVTVTVTSDNPGIVSVQSPGTVFIAEGATGSQIGLDGTSAGTTIVRGNATGHVEGTFSVQVSPLFLSLPSILNVPFGGTASIPVQISTPAPVGGEVVSLVSSDPAVVTVITPTVTIPEGSQTANGTVSGTLPGTATVTGTSTTYGAAQSSVSTTANLNIVQTSATLSEGFPISITVRLESSGLPVAAPAPGVTVTLTAVDPGCAAVNSPVTIPTGLVDVDATLSYGGSTTTPCTTDVTATAANITSDFVTATVNPSPGITLPSTTTGSGLQRSSSGTLGASNHGGVDVVIKSSNPQVLLISPDAVTPGTDSIVVSLADGFTGFSYYVQGVEGTTGSATVTATAPVFTDGTATVDVLQPAVEIWNVATSTTTLSVDDPFEVWIGVPNAGNTGMSAYLAVRAGAPAPFTATVVSSDVAVGQLVTTAQTGGTVTVDVVEGATNSATTVAAGGVAFEPLTSGSTTLSATIPGFVSLPLATRDISVGAPGITLSNTLTGSGLQQLSSGTLNASNHGGVDVVIKSSNPQVLLISPDAVTPGTDSIVVSLTDGIGSFSYYVQGVEGVVGTVTATVNATASGFTDGTATVDVSQPALEIWDLQTSHATTDADDPFEVWVGVPNAANTAMAAYLAVRAGAPAPFTATVVSSDVAVGQLVTTAQSGGTVTVQIVEGEGLSPRTVVEGGVAFDALTAGTTTVSATIPGYVILPLASRTVTISP